MWPERKCVLSILFFATLMLACVAPTHAAKYLASQADAITVTGSNLGSGSTITVNVKLKATCKDTATFGICANTKLSLQSVISYCSISLGSSDNPTKKSECITLKTFTDTASYTSTIPRAFQHTESLKLPNTVSSGTGYIVVFTDSDEKYSQDNKSDNGKQQSITIAGRPDLYVKTLTATPKEITPTSTLLVQYQICNKGNAGTNKTVYARFYFSDDSTITTSDTYINKQVSINLGVGGCTLAPAFSQFTTGVQLTSYGTRYFGVIVDYNSLVTESDENNNTGKVELRYNALDKDKDGVPGNLDCDDNDNTVYPAYNGKPAGTDVCDGKDNNCDNKIDNIAEIGKSCTDNRRKGICQEGTWVCLNNTKTCEQKNQPSFEVCDGKDNDCNGQIDDAPSCKEGGSTEPKVESVTEPKPEPKLEPVTEPKPEPVTEPKVEPVTEPKAEPKAEPTLPDEPGVSEPASDAGVSEKTQEKPPADSCDNVTCHADEYCNAGKCLKACGCTKCDQGKNCKDGTCVDDPCGGVSCDAGKVCEASSGRCIDDLCAGVNCEQGEVCQEGSCVADPCVKVKCYGGQKCWKGQCYDESCIPKPTPAEPTQEAADEPKADAGAGKEDSKEDRKETSQEASQESVAEKTTEGGGVADKTSGGDGPAGDGDSPGGCACHAGPTAFSQTLMLALVLLLLGSVVRFRRKSSSLLQRSQV